MYNTLILFFFGAFILLGCGKPAHEINPNYLGNWEASNGSATYHITISSTPKESSFANNEGNVYIDGKGTAKISGNKLRIGLKKFIIDQEPTPDPITQYYFMILNGRTYYKI